MWPDAHLIPPYNNVIKHITINNTWVQKKGFKDLRVPNGILRFQNLFLRIQNLFYGPKLVFKAPKRIFKGPTIDF